MIRVTDDLILRSYKPEDAPELFRCVQANRVHLREFLPWVDSTLKEQDSLNFITDMTFRESKQSALAMGIFRKNVLIGGIGMHEWDHYLKRCQIGYWLAAEQQGKGYMLQCATCFIDFLFRTLDMNKVEIHFLPFNLRSGALAEKLHAKTEGIIRAGYKIHGSLEDVVIAGILKNEWKK